MSSRRQTVVFALIAAAVLPLTALAQVDRRQPTDRALGIS